MGFGIVAAISNKIIASGRKLGRSFGYELAVVSSSHTLSTKMEAPAKTERAWDPDHYRHGNLFVSGHANAIKPRVEYHKELEDPNQVDVEESGESNDDVHTDIISSPRYREYMRQDLISQLLNPKEQWKKILYAIIIVAALTFVNVALSASAAGVL